MHRLHVNTPVNAKDAATKRYVDDKIAVVATTEYVDSENNAQDVVISGKADTSYVNSQNAAQDAANATADNLRVLKAGDTMTGPLTSSYAGVRLYLNEPTSSTQSAIVGRKGGLNRWTIFPGDSTAEGAEGVGSNFVIQRSNNAGSSVENTLTLSRLSGHATFANNLTVNKGGLNLVATSPDWVLMNMYKSVSGISNTIQSYTGSNQRWRIDIGDPTPETGSNAGSDLHCYCYNDAGTVLVNAFSIFRATGNARFLGAAVGVGCTPGSWVGYGNTTAGINLNSTGTANFSCTNFAAITANTNVDGYLIPCYRSGTLVGGLHVTTTTTALATSSDMNLKEDLKEFDAGLILDKTNVYDFKWKETGKRSYGIIAQQAKDVYPDATIYSEDSDRWAIDYAKYIPLLVQAVKDLRDRMRTLEGRTEIS